MVALFGTEATPILVMLVSMRYERQQLHETRLVNLAVTAVTDRSFAQLTRADVVY
jgi:hypothetical protein